MSQMSVSDEPAQVVAVIRKQVAMGELGGFFPEAFAAVAGAVQRAGGSVAGPPFGWYHGMPTEEVDVAAGFPVTDVPEGALDGEVAVLERPGGLAAVALHIGSMDDLGATYRELEAWLRDRQLDRGEQAWEEYLSDPTAQPDPTTWQTRIVWPLQ